MDDHEAERMRTRNQDIVWAVVAAVFGAATVVDVVLLALDFSLMGLLGLAFPALIAAGAWRRTKWGAPRGGLREMQERRAARPTRL